MLRELVSWEDLQKHDGEIICFGVGMVFRHIEQLLSVHGIFERVSYIVDNDSEKWGLEVYCGGRIYRVLSIEGLEKKVLKNPLILICCEKDREIMEQLSSVDLFGEWKVASYPKLNHLYRRKQTATIPIAETGYYIPKIIHSIWFGKKAMPCNQRNFMAGWQRLCPDYSFMLWNESNYDVGQCSYIEEAYNAGDYARVSDYVRMDVLYRYGGFYMDTDVELLKSLDMLRMNMAVFTYGEWPVVNSGVLCGAVPGHELIRRIRDIPRAEIHYYNDMGEPDKKTNCYYENEVLKTMGFKGDFTSQTIKGAVIYSPAFFASIGRYFAVDDITEDTIAVHHCVGSWKRG